MNKYELTPFSYQNSISSTKEFQDWWERQYSASISSEDALLLRVSSGFKTSLLEQVKTAVTKGNFFC
jgi:phosphoheptose isomerase